MVAKKPGSTSSQHLVIILLIRRGVKELVEFIPDMNVTYFKEQGGFSEPKFHVLYVCRCYEKQ